MKIIWYYSVGLAEIRQYYLKLDWSDGGIEGVVPLGNWTLSM